MTNTTYYELNIVEGTDIVNPLTVDNPNYEKIDEAMHNNAVAGVTLATEIANATVHAITRENSDCAVIRFISTSRWKAGDTATVDGVPVTALLPSGETLPDGAYVINANVLCILTGTNLTVYVEGKKAVNANEITFNDTTVGAELVRLDEEAVRLDGEVARLDVEINNLSEFHTLDWDNAVDIEVSASSNTTVNTSYTPTKNGMYFICAQSPKTTIAQCKITDTTSNRFMAFFYIADNYNRGSAIVPLNANRQITITLANCASVTYSYFVPFK